MPRLAGVPIAVKVDRRTDGFRIRYRGADLVVKVYTPRQAELAGRAEQREEFYILVLLAALGIYGVLAQSVAERTQEIGIRISLGASRSSIVLSAMRQMRAVAIGAVIGLVAAWALARALKNMVYGLAAIEPLSALAATALLLGVAALAVFVPAHRASRIDPMKVLRLE